MKLILQNSLTNEFTPGCEWTAVDIDDGLMDTISARGRAFREVQAGDETLWQVRYWDFRAVCFNGFEAMDAVVPKEADMPFDGWIESDGGWVVVDTLVIPETAVVSIDCSTMTIGMEGNDITVGWVYNLKDSPEVIRTAVVSKEELGRRLKEYPGLPSAPADRST